MPLNCFFYGYFAYKPFREGFFSMEAMYILYYSSLYLHHCQLYTTAVRKIHPVSRHSSFHLTSRLVLTFPLINRTTLGSDSGMRQMLLL